MFGALILVSLVVLWQVHVESGQTLTNWLDDTFLPVYRSIRLGLNHVLRRSIASRQNKAQLRKYDRYQEKLDDTKAFPCAGTSPLRSPNVPKTAHQVRPGDIDVIGAIGDSITAGMGTSATDLLQLIVDDRGKSFSGGGEGNWRTTLTLPNILKVFNSNLIITMMIGANDFCIEVCYQGNPYDLLEKHRVHLLQALRSLRDGLPKTIVVIIPPPFIRPVVEFKDRPPVCRMMHSFLCPCLAGLAYRNQRETFDDVMRKWQLLDIEIANSREFDLEDFTVIPLNMTLNYTFPKHPDGQTNYGYLSSDCFHLSERGHARFANGVWNSLLEPFGSKSLDGSDTFSKFYCPTKEQPFIFTRRNSSP
ncbi:unnamed protein product [Callosobruchus maculatus]|uniref:Uncharacterized protein n=1 Tax=Callosobruchus maculatus TaxID=64391 RepID=A0A653CUQ5_CALMS|nr:unnamed protein product [Callosobruchus maculatus]